MGPITLMLMRDLHSLSELADRLTARLKVDRRQRLRGPSRCTARLVDKGDPRNEVASQTTAAQMVTNPGRRTATRSAAPPESKEAEAILPEQRVAK